MATTSKFTADYIMQVEALNRQKDSYESLIAEMESFSPTPLTDEEKEQMKSEKDRMYSLNPGKDRAQIDTLVEYQFAPDLQWQRTFGNRRNDSFMFIVFLSSTVIEAHINIYLSLRCISSNIQEMFEDIEKLDVLKKWILVPRLFVPDYAFPKGKTLYNTLKQLISTRNIMAHYKVEYIKDGTRVLKGKPLDRKRFDKESRQLLLYCDLPRCLLAHLLKYDNSDDMRQLVMMSGLSQSDIDKVLATTA